MAIPDLKPLVEALIFAADGPLKADRIADVLELECKDVMTAIRALEQDYTDNPRGFFLQEISGGYQLRSRPEYADYLRKLGKSRPFRFSKPALESLAIIAYRQPITRAEVEYLRGVDSGSVLKTLLEKHLVRILGKKDVPGKPLIYGTTKEFLELFGLPDLASLPTLREFSELAEEEMPEGILPEEARAVFADEPEPEDDDIDLPETGDISDDDTDRDEADPEA